MADVVVLVRYVPTEITDTKGTTAGTVVYLFGSGRDPIATSGKPLHPSSLVSCCKLFAPVVIGCAGRLALHTPYPL